jgi:hypothetical protein
MQGHTAGAQAWVSYANAIAAGRVAFSREKASSTLFQVTNTADAIQHHYY